MENPLKVRLHIISPVHIGCDDVYEPTSFAIDEKKKKLIEFDTMNFIKSLSSRDKQEFTRICMEGSISSIVKLYNFISNKKPGGREIDIASGLISHYEDVKKLLGKYENEVKEKLNKFTIGRTAYNPHNNLPYIPGSSIKGAMRTAYLSKPAREQKITDCWDKYLHGKELETDQDKYFFIGKKQVSKRLEKDLLNGEFDTDPFRMFKPSDFLPIGNVKTKIIYAVNRKRCKSEKPTMADSGPPQILEIIQSDSIFEGIINIQQPEKIAGITKAIEEKEFLKSMNAFYMPLFNGENKVTKEINAGSIVGNRINEKFKDTLGETAFLIRIGRHSGAEAVTIEGNRNIKIMQGKGQPPKFLDHATTIWLASETSKPTTNNGLIPFGWAVMEAG